VSQNLNTHVIHISEVCVGSVCRVPHRAMQSPMTTWRTDGATPKKTQDRSTQKQTPLQCAYDFYETDLSLQQQQHKNVAPWELQFQQSSKLWCNITWEEQKNLVVSHFTRKLIHVSNTLETNQVLNSNASPASSHGKAKSVVQPKPLQQKQRTVWQIRKSV